jgi:hypothetical protein
MLERVRERMTYANAMATLAMFIALGLGSAWAATELGRNSVGARQIEKNAVKRPEIAKNAVRKAEVRKNAIGTAEVMDGALLEQDFAPGQLPAGPPGEQGERGPQGEPGPTEGFGLDAFSASLPSEQLVDNESFTTTRAGRLFLAMTIRPVLVDCSLGDPRFFLEIRTDGVDTRVPGAVADVPDNARHSVHLSGVTSTSVPPGEHEVLARIDCPSGTATNTSVSGDSGVSAIVLGD